MTETLAEEATSCLPLVTEIVYEATVTYDEKTAVLELMLPENFYVFKKICQIIWAA